MAYHSDYYDTNEYRDKPHPTHCDECGQEYEQCRCLLPDPEEPRVSFLNIDGSQPALSETEDLPY